MKTLKDFAHLRPKAGEPALIIRNVMVEGRYQDVCVLPEGVESVFLGKFGNGAVLPGMQCGSEG